MVRQLAAALMPALVGLAHRCQQGGFVGVGVEQRFLVLRLEQQLMGVLTVDLDQALPQLTQLRQRHGGAVDKAARTAVGVDHPAQQAFVAVVQLVLLQPRARGRGVRQREAGADVGAGGSQAHHVAVGAVAEAQPQRIDGDGFAGAGFTGDRRHARLKINFQLTNDSKVADG